jgi:hypothetical protein
MGRTALAGRDASDDVRPVINHLKRVKRAFFSRDPLNDQACVFID